MSLTPKQRLLHYELIEKLGQGGMGEVWRAADTKLDREVAIKVLPDTLSRDPERIARFEREAKAVARLSHPNIVTVHSVEESDGLRFVTMEIVRGSLLAERIPHGGLPLDRLFEVAISIADAVAAAHRQGVTHRDLKPGNVMVGDDGRVKVLDFGLAKVANDPAAPAGASQLPTQTVTAEGKILGTVAYMSPEQAEGKTVDFRSDIFSLGVMLYEMATGRRPFQGETPASTMSAILRDTPPSVTDLRQTLPRHLGRIIKRCLTKDPDRRYQTALDLRNELQELRDELRSEPGLARPGVARAASRQRTWRFAVTAGTLAMIALGYIGYRAWSPHSPPEDSVTGAGHLTMVPLTQSGTVRDAGISPDGRYLAYVTLEGGRFDLRVEQIAVGNERQIVAPTERTLSFPKFAHDGEYVYYFAWDETQGSVERVPILGGPPEKIVEQVAGDFDLSLDGHHIAYLGRAGESRAVFVASADGSGVREVGEQVGYYPNRLAWSADGEQLIIGDTFGTEGRLRLIPADGGPLRSLGTEVWSGIFALATIPDGRGLLLSGQQGPRNFHRPAQIWYVSLQGPGLRRLTSDFNSYRALSLDRSGKRLVAVQERFEHALWVLPGGEESEMRRVSFTSQSGPYWAGVAWLPDGRLLYEDLDGEALQLWAARPDGSGRQRLSHTGGFNMGAAVSNDGSTVAYFSDREGAFRIWLVGVDGTGARPLTSGERFGEEVFPQFSPDGRWVYYHVLSTETGHPSVRRAAVEGGPSAPVFEGLSMFPAVSPDGTRLAFVALDPEDRKLKILVTDLEGKEVLVKIDHTFSNALPVVRWTPDGSGVAATSLTGQASNVLVHPLDGGPPRQITHFTEGVTLGFGWSAGGESMAVVLGEKHADAVLITGFLLDDR